MDDPSIIMARLCSFSYRFSLPATLLLDFQESFRRYMPPEGNSLAAFPTALRITQMAQSRTDMAHELASGTPHYGNAIKGAKQYVSLIAQCLHSIENSTEPVLIDKQLNFSWATGLGEKPRSSFISNKAFILDKVMALATQALCLADLVCGRDGSGVSPEIGFPMAGKTLREAAGIFEYLRREELPRWIGQTAKQDRIPEVSEGVCEALAIFCLAEAQAMATAKAISDIQSRASLLAKLCLGVASQMEECCTVLRSKTGVMFERLNRPFLTHMTFEVQLFKALAHKFYSDDAWSNDKFGLSIKHLHEAIALLKPRGDAMARGVPELDGPLSVIASDVTKLRGCISNSLRERVKENSSVYFDPIPSALELLPEGMFIMKPIPYEPTELHAWEFITADKLMRTPSTKSLNGESVSVSEPQPPSDGGNEKNTSQIEESSGGPIPSEPRSQPATN